MKYIWALVMATAATSAGAQTFESNTNGFETPLGMGSVQDIDSPAARTRDENFNRTVINMAGPQFVATAVGNLVNVNVTGNNNTVNLNVSQTNSGNQTVFLNTLGQENQ